MEITKKTATVTMTTAQALLRFLDNQYIEMDGKETKFIKGVMGIFGHGNVTGMGQALEEDTSLTYIQGKNEQGMVHAATAFAKQMDRKQIYACTTSIGPGALNMVTAAGTATVNRIPVLLLPGDIFATRQPDPVLQQIEQPNDYTVGANDAFKPVSRYWDRVSRPEQLMSAMIHAMRVLTDPVDTGAVTISLPQDVQGEAYAYPESFFKKRVHLVERRIPSEQSIERAVKLIKEKSRPVIIAGGGILYAEAMSELCTFANKYNIPVGETQAGKSSLNWKEPLNMGGTGANGTSAANYFTKRADLVIGVGTRLTDFSTSSKTAFENPEVDFLNINVSNMDAMKLDAQMIVADAKIALKKLINHPKLDSYKSSYDEQELRVVKDDWLEVANEYLSGKSDEGLVQTNVLGEINQLVEPNDTIVCAAGSMPGDLLRLWRPEQPKSYHMEYGFSCMGYEVSGALGVKLAKPQDEVYALVGDGSYLMLHSELITSIQEGQKINVVLLDNHGFQCIHGLQVGQGSKGFGNEFRYRNDKDNQLTGSYMPIDFAANAASYGAKSYRVHTIEELRAALKDAKKQTVSTLIDIKVLPGTGSSSVEESWWHLGLAEVSTSEAVGQARQKMTKQLETAKKY